jgi:hypothetical protein
MITLHILVPDPAAIEMPPVQEEPLTIEDESS